MLTTGLVAGIGIVSAYKIHRISLEYCMFLNHMMGKKMLTIANLTLPKHIALLPLGYVHLIGYVKSISYPKLMEI